MPAGRPNNSTTPLWRSKPAVKVSMYHFLCFLEHKEPTKYGCAKKMGISRTTAYKWFDATRWSKERNEQYWAVKVWLNRQLYENCRCDSWKCSSDLALKEDNVRLFIEMTKIEKDYVTF